MAWPIIAAAGIAAAGQILGGMQANQANREESMRNRQFQEDMYRHRHRYEVEDLRKAGLNPILSASTGGGTVPSGGMANFQNPMDNIDLANPVANATRVSEIEKERIELEREALKSTVDLNSANTLATLEKAKTEQTQQNLNNATVAKVEADKGLIPYNKALLAHMSLKEKTQANVNTATALRTQEEFIIQQLEAAQASKEANSGQTTANRWLDTASKIIGLFSGGAGILGQARMRKMTGKNP